MKFTEIFLIVILSIPLLGSGPANSEEEEGGKTHRSL